MTIIVTRDVLPRVRGFLSSCALELAPGVYTAPRMTRAVRDRIWDVLFDWFASEPSGSILMTWPDRTLPGGQAIRALGVPAKSLFDADGLFLVRSGFGDL